MVDSTTSVKSGLRRIAEMKPLSMICYILLGSFGALPFALIIGDMAGVVKLKPVAAPPPPVPPPAKVSDHDLTNYMEHDALGRITKVFYKNGTTIEYKYDSNGNQLDRIVRHAK